MKYIPIRARDNLDELKAKLKAFGYPYEQYHTFIYNHLLYDRMFSSPEVRREIRPQIRRLERLKKSTLKKLIEIYSNIEKAYSGETSDTIEEITSEGVSEYFEYDTFSSAIDGFIKAYRHKGTLLIPARKGDRTVDYVLAAVLSLVVRDSRGARWKDIYELLRWFNKHKPPGAGQLHTKDYNQINLKDEVKYLMEKYGKDIEFKKQIFFKKQV